ncbi:MAG: hypothetical protein AAGB51_12415 [Planctomycetota bacterium]
MSDSPASRYLAVGGNDAALALEEAFDLLVRSDFPNKTYLANFEIPGIVQRRDIGPGQVFNFREIGELTDPQNYTEGTEMLGESYAFDNGSVTLDPYVVRHNFLPMGQVEDDQWEPVMPLVREHVEGHARLVDKRGFAMLTAAARASAKTKTGTDGSTSHVIHNGGNVVERIGATGITAAYPATKTGAHQLRDDIAQGQQLAAEDDAPYGGITAFMPHYLKRVLAKDDRSFDRDLSSNTNDLNAYDIAVVDGVRCVFTNNLPSTNIGATDLGGTAALNLPTKYQGDFRFNGATGQPVVLMAWGADNGRAPIGYVTRSGPQTFTEFQQRKLGTLLGSYHRFGWGIIHPPGSVEIRVKNA